MSSQFRWAALLLAAFVSVRAQTPLGPAAFIVVPGVQFGPIRQDTRAADLARLLPGAAIRDADVYLGEGFCTPGTRVFPGTPDEVDIAWQDAARTRVAFVRTISPGRWVTRAGVRIGTPLSELEKISKRVLTFSGFGWDYGGGLSWEEGTGSIGLRVDVVPEDRDRAHTATNAAQIFGDRQVRSDHPLVRTLRIEVEQMMQVWGNVFAERECG